VAWTTPAIVLAVSVPRAAASGEPPGQIFAYSFSAWVTAGSPANKLRINIGYVQNQGADDPGPLTFRITVPHGEALPTFDDSNVGAGWVVSGPDPDTPADEPWVYVWTNATGLATGAGSDAGALVLDRPDGAPASGTLTITGTSNGGANSITIQGVSTGGSYPYGTQ